LKVAGCKIRLKNNGMKLKIFRIGLIVGALIILIWEIFLLDFADLTWKNNESNYLTSIAMILVITSMIISLISKQKIK
jgi:hypothetical protein